MATKAPTCFRRHWWNSGQAIQLLPVFIGFIAGGCGSGPQLGMAIHGQVTYQGKPVESGTLTFTNIGSSTVRPMSVNIVNGGYSLLATEGLLAGTYRVQIEGYRKTGRKIPDLASPLAPNQKRALIDERMPYLPARFNERSNLQAHISTDGQEVNFDLQ